MAEAAKGGTKGAAATPSVVPSAAKQAVKKAGVKPIGEKPNKQGKQDIDPDMIITKSDAVLKRMEAVVEAFKESRITHKPLSLAELSGLMTQSKTTLGNLKKVHLNIANGHSRLIAFNSWMARVGLLQHVLKLCSRKPNHPVSLKELDDALASLRSDDILKTSVPGHLLQWELELRTVFRARQNDNGDLLVSFGMQGAGSGPGSTIPTVKELFSSQEQPSKKSMLFMVAAKTFMVKDKDDQDVTKELMSGLIPFLYQAAQCEEQPIGVDLKVLLTVRIAAFFQSHWPRLHQLEGANLTMAVDAARASEDCHSDIRLRDLTKVISSVSKLPGCEPAMRIFAGGNQGIHRATNFFNKMQHWSLVLSKLSVMDGQCQQVLSEHFKAEAEAIRKGGQTLSEHICDMDLSVVAPLAEAYRRFHTTQVNEAKKPPASAEHIEVLKMIETAEGVTTNGIRLCSTAPCLSGLKAGLNLAALRHSCQALAATGDYEVVHSVVRAAIERIDAARKNNLRDGGQRNNAVEYIATSLVVLLPGQQQDQQQLDITKVA